MTSSRGSGAGHYRWLTQWQEQAAVRQVPHIEVSRHESRTIYAVTTAVADQIEKDELAEHGADRASFFAHCDALLRKHCALIELAQICEEGRLSGRPSSKPWLNNDAWQNTYLALAARIADGRVDIGRPLHGLAYTTARHFFLSECRRLRRFAELNEEHVQRFNAGDERTPAELASASRRGELLRGNLVRLTQTGKLSERDLVILTQRYVEERGASAVAGAVGIGADNVRQICARRCRLLREELAGQGIEDKELT
jgi:DNA-directed RNA polymerase specialized sigma24 family protein